MASGQQKAPVCITLNKDKVGATLRIDLPKQPGAEIHFAQTVAAYLTTDEHANAIVFALYTTKRPEPSQSRPHRATIAALTGVFAREGIAIRDGIYVTDTAYSPYDTRPGEDIAIPISSTEYSRATPNSSTEAAPSHPPAKRKKNDPKVSMRPLVLK